MGRAVRAADAPLSYSAADRPGLRPLRLPVASFVAIHALPCCFAALAMAPRPASHLLPVAHWHSGVSATVLSASPKANPY